MSTRPLRLHHINDSADTSIKRIDLTNTAQYINISRSSASGTLNVSFDGKTFFSITTDTITLNALFNSFYVSASESLTFSAVVGGADVSSTTTFAPPFAIPLTTGEYTSIGFPAPTYIWDMGVADVPFTELVSATHKLEDLGANSDGWLFQTALGIGAPQVGATRNTLNTSRSLVSDISVLDVTTTERVAVGFMFKEVLDPIANRTIFSKRSGFGWEAVIKTSTRFMRLFARSATAGDFTCEVAADHALNVWHYCIAIIDRDSGVELMKVHTELGTNTTDISTADSLTSAIGAGFTSGANAGEIIGACAAWEGATVASLTSDLPAKFLTAVGV